MTEQEVGDAKRLDLHVENSTKKDVLTEHPGKIFASALNDLSGNITS